MNISNMLHEIPDVEAVPSATDAAVPLARHAVARVALAERGEDALIAHLVEAVQAVRGSLEVRPVDVADARARRRVGVASVHRIRVGVLDDGERPSRVRHVDDDVHLSAVCVAVRLLLRRASAHLRPTTSSKKLG